MGPLIELSRASSDYARRRLWSSVVGQRARDGQPLRHETGERLLHPTRLVVLRPPLGVRYTAYDTDATPIPRSVSTLLRVTLLHPHHFLL